MRVLQALFISIAIHFLLALLVERMPAPAPKSDNVTIEIVPAEKFQNRQQIVRDHLVPDKLKAEESEDPLKFLSEKTQRVKKQTQAAVNGMTKNRGQDNPAKKANSQTQQDPRQPGGMDAYAPQYKTLPSLAEGSDAGVSTIGESLPNEVTIGSFTALNTDRYLYYSFYARIEDLIRYRWESAVQRTIDSTPPSQFNNVRNSWVTNLEIWLKSNGEYHSAHLMKESGIKGFDQAAVQAFIQARLFPNPPKEMVESDGLIKLKYVFRVYHKPTVLGRQ